jgi:peptidoglycan/xylan/chitin deacetylase (PgdA/CDA1 family)
VPPRQYENGPFASEKASFYEFPWASQSLSSPTASFMMTQITTAMNTDGFVVVGLHPQNFATGLEPNPTAINELASLLAQVKARNYNIVPVRAIPNDVDPNADHRYRVPNCSCVAFRLDDIQNFALKTHQKAIMDLFKQFDASITVGIIGSLFGLEDPDIVGYIQDKLAQQTPCFQFEVANHGYLHETFSNFAYEEQLSRIQLTQEKISQTLGVTPKTFIPPYNAFNNNTIRALQTTGFSYMSSYTTAEPMPLDNSVIYRVPSGASTSDLLVSDHFTPVPTQQTWNSIRSQLDLMGFASVMMHPYEFTGWTGTGYNDVLNSAQLNELRSLLQLCRDHGLRFVTLRDVQKYFNPYEVYPCTGQPLETSSAATTGSTHSQGTGTGTQTQTQTSNTGTNTGTSTRTQTGTQTQSGTRTQSGTQTQTQSGTQSGTNTDIPTSTDSGEDPISVSSKLVLPNAIVLAILFCVVQLFL